MDQNGDFSTGARMIMAALVSAVVTATLVIAIGQSVLHRTPGPTASGDVVLVRTVG